MSTNFRNRTLADALDAALRDLESVGSVSEHSLADLSAQQRDALAEMLALESELAGGIAPRRRFGRFRVVRLLGVGGMASVFLGEDVESGEQVALKTPLPHLCEIEGYRKRFEREADAGSRVRHPNVARVLGTTTLQLQGRDAPALVLEYVRGTTLRAQLTENGRLPLERLIHLAEELCHALTAIHAAGVVHRDLKPENVLLTTDGGVRVLDLGIAWLRDAQVQLTGSDEFLGTLTHAAPEQFAPGRRAPDSRADLFALGVTLFEAGTGRFPWYDNGSRSGPVVRQLVPRRRMRDIEGETPAWLDELVDCLLQPDPGVRPASAAEVLTRVRSGSVQTTSARRTVTPAPWFGELAAQLPSPWNPAGRVVVLVAGGAGGVPDLEDVVRERFLEVEESLRFVEIALDSGGAGSPLAFDRMQISLEKLLDDASGDRVTVGLLTTGAEHREDAPALLASLDRVRARPLLLVTAIDGALRASWERALARLAHIVIVAPDDSARIDAPVAAPTPDSQERRLLTAAAGLPREFRAADLAVAAGLSPVAALRALRRLSRPGGGVISVDGAWRLASPRGSTGGT